MPYDFDRLTDRTGTFSMKWDVEDNELPMWVADMDFATAPAVIAAIRQRADHGIFGYTVVPDEYDQAIRQWWTRRHGFAVEKDWILFATGVVPAISSIVRKVTSVGENVLIQPPVYNIFYNSIYNNGRHLLESRLSYDGHDYGIDFDDLERKLADPQTSLMILCNPHNPVGKVWDRESLARIGTLCAQHDVLVIADEIHCDLTDPGVAYTPFASVSDTCAQLSMTCIAPTKAFNLAGLQTASVVVPDPLLRHRVNRGLNTDEVAEPNAFAMAASIAAFSAGEPWLEELRVYIKANKDLATDFIRRNIPGIKVPRSEATYLLWLDCRGITNSGQTFLHEFLRAETGLYLSDGASYGENGRFFLRMNLATQRSRVMDGLERLRDGVQRYRENFSTDS